MIALLFQQLNDSSKTPMVTITRLDMPRPSGEELKAARIAAGLSQVQAAELMGYALQAGSRGGVQSRTWQALESTTDDRNMQEPGFAMFLLLTGQHPKLSLVEKCSSDPGCFELLHGAKIGIS